MEAEFEPSKEITCGNWYVVGNLDTEFINLLKDQCIKLIYRMKVPTFEGISDAIQRSGIFKVVFTSQQIEDRRLKVSHKCASKGGKAKPRIRAMASIPCGFGPWISMCSPDGVLSPKTCIYYEKWLDF
ncbi:RNA polymerase Rpc [Parasponia andersonii]|uniref:RNA polymerase Rpc n=1 Tax=Parasponia andersonii TaxID=3476 RepID=A0A2P5BQ58_PARAD|nr:RNA polymerase Rpc [Parasponia andersonii]